MNKYQNGKIYKLVCDNSPLVYYGSTIQKLSVRLALHKYKSKGITNCGSKELFQLGKVSIHEIEKYPCNSKKELEAYERIYIEFILKNFDYKIICNKQVPGRSQQESSKEWYVNNKEKEKKRQKEYREKNKEHYNLKKREKITCECGSYINIGGKERHKKSKKHINYVNGL